MSQAGEQSETPIGTAKNAAALLMTRGGVNSTACLCHTTQESHAIARTMCSAMCQFKGGEAHRRPVRLWSSSMLRWD
eukprot:1567657-Pleurochrysis_carterae.AAC.2